MQPEMITIDLQLYQIVVSLALLVFSALFSVTGILWLLDRRATKNEIKAGFENINTKLGYMEQNIIKAEANAERANTRLTDHIVKEH